MQNKPAHVEIMRKDMLVGGLEHVFFFPYIGIIIPTDELIFFRGVGIPPTSMYTDEKAPY